MRAYNLSAFRFIRQEVIDLRNRPIEDRYLKAMVIHIEDQVLAHDRQPD
jgi:hypothetical protein